MLSALLGVAGALTPVNYALGGRQKVAGQLARLGTNVLTITPRASRAIGGRARTGQAVTTLVESDYDALRREIPLLAGSSAYVTQNFLVKAGDLAKNNATVIGVEPGYMAIKHWDVAAGRAMEAADERHMFRVAWLGSSAAVDLFGNAPPVGRRVLINRVPFEVAGVLSERGQGLDAANEDRQVYVPLSTMMRRLANLDYYSGIVLEVDRWDNMDHAAGAARTLLHRRHRVVGKLPDDFDVQNQKELLDTQLASSRDLLLYVRGIAASVLAMSGLGVLAISWIGVRERTREIGARRALGATVGDVFTQLIGESAALSTIGCLAGLLLAVESASQLAKWANQPVVFDRGSGWLAITTAITLDLVFAAIPARTAARLDPVEALRFE
jgi:putative ABC transport system permease protein